MPTLRLCAHSDIRELFRPFHFERKAHTHTVGGGACGNDVGELLILSWHVKAKAGGLF